MTWLLEGDWKGIGLEISFPKELNNDKEEVILCAILPHICWYVYINIAMMDANKELINNSFKYIFSALRLVYNTIELLYQCNNKFTKIILMII